VEDNRSKRLKHQQNALVTRFVDNDLNAVGCMDRERDKQEECHWTKRVDACYGEEKEDKWKRLACDLEYQQSKNDEDSEWWRIEEAMYAIG